MTVPVYHALAGVLKRKGFPDVMPSAPATPMTRPTGAGFYAIEDLGVGMDFHAASAKVKTLAAAPDGRRTLTLPEYTFEATGFARASNWAGFLVDEGVSVVGSGFGTKFRVAPDTITQAQVDSWYPPDVYGNTIQLSVFVVPNGTNVRVAQLSIEGTQQRVGGTGAPAGYDTYHYDGLNLYNLVNPLIEDVLVKGIPGYKNTPPGETFHCSTYLGSGARFYRVEVDGRNAAGVRVGAAGFGTNTYSNAYFEDCYAHHMACSHGFAFWETKGIQTLRCIAENNGGVGGGTFDALAGDGFNHERSFDTVHRFPRVGGNTLCELRYFAENQGDAYDGDTTGHQIYDLTVTDGGALDIRIDGSQTVLPTLTRCPAPVYSIN